MLSDLSTIIYTIILAALAKFCLTLVDANRKQQDKILLQEAAVHNSEGNEYRDGWKG